MTDFENQVADAVVRIQHGDDCAIRGEVNPEGPCDCDRDARLALRVAAAIEAAWRFNPYNRNVEGVLRALRGISGEAP